MHTVLKSLRNARRVENTYEALAELSKKQNNFIAFVMPDSVLEHTRADVIIPHADIVMERLSTDMKYETLEIKEGTILGVFPGDIFYPEADKVMVTPYYIANGAREILNRCQYKKKHRIYNIPLYSEEYLRKEKVRKVRKEEA
jgi:hypothetical protein